ncbi:MAG: phosphoesterase [Chlorobi bacterium]|nr:phosphoesterase [Chlorobiota bacterium]
MAPAVSDPTPTPPVVATTIPTADPGEPFLDMAQQILGLATTPTSNPYGSPAGKYGMMGGFVANYPLQSSNPVAEQIMMYMTPELMPVTAFLANNYMVCDEWYGSVPTQTFANRLYSLCADSGTWTNGLSGDTLRPGRQHAQHSLRLHVRSYVDHQNGVGLLQPEQRQRCQPHRSRCRGAIDSSRAQRDSCQQHRHSADADLLLTAP